MEYPSGLAFCRVRTGKHCSRPHMKAFSKLFMNHLLRTRPCVGGIEQWRHSFSFHGTEQLCWGWHTAGCGPSLPCHLFFFFNGLLAQKGFFIFFKRLKKIFLIKDILWNVKILWHENFSVHKQNVIGTQPLLFVYILFLTTFVLWWQNWVEPKRF